MVTQRVPRKVTSEFHHPRLEFVNITLIKINLS